METKSMSYFYIQYTIYCLQDIEEMNIKACHGETCDVCILYLMKFHSCDLSFLF